MVSPELYPTSLVYEPRATVPSVTIVRPWASAKVGGSHLSAKLSDDFLRDGSFTAACSGQGSSADGGSM